MGLRPRVYPVLPALLALALAAVVLLPYRSVPFARGDGVTVAVPAGLSHLSDAWDYLQLGRELHAGEGFRSLFTYTPFLPESVPTATASAAAPSVSVHAPGSVPPAAPRVTSFPLLWRQPVYPALVAASYVAAGGPHPDAVLVLQALVLVALPLAVYALGRRVLEPGWAALAALWALLSPLLLGLGDPLVATTLFGTWVALLFLAAIRLRGPAGAGLLGVLIGLGFLLRVETMLIAPGVMAAFVLARGDRPLRALALVLAAAILTALPWRLHVASVTGTPFYGIHTLGMLAYETDSFPAQTGYRSLVLRGYSLGGFVLAHGGDLAAKAAPNVARYLRDLVFLPSIFLAPFFWLGLLRGGGDPRARALVAGTAIAAGLVTVGLAPVSHSGRYLAPLVPALAVGAAWGMAGLPRHRRGFALAATVVGGLVLGLALTGRQTSESAATAARDHREILARPEAAALAREVVLLSDAPTVYAWVWERPAIWAPMEGDLARVRELVGETMAILSSAERGGVLEDDVAARYVRAGGTRAGTGYPALVTWPEGSP